MTLPGPGLLNLLSFLTRGSTGGLTNGHLRDFAREVDKWRLFLSIYGWGTEPAWINRIYQIRKLSFYGFDLIELSRKLKFWRRVMKNL